MEAAPPMISMGVFYRDGTNKKAADKLRPF
jgi:hypothetical protein